jgi:hypothetical protein
MQRLDLLWGVEYFGKQVKKVLLIIKIIYKDINILK